MTKLIYLIPMIFALTSCVPKKDQIKTIDFNSALQKFETEFPPKWPAKDVTEPLSVEQKSIIDDMLTSVSQHFTKNKVDHKVSGYEILILPTKSSKLNEISSELAADQIALMYNALYFARNPFSEGTFISESKQLLLSQSILNSPAKMEKVLNHEMVHVATYKNMLQKKPSDFYCVFKGSQFAPHSLSCDEMNAYAKELKRLIATKAGKSEIKKKLTAAEMHTRPIIDLISKLNYKTSKSQDGIVVIEGKNNQGEYRIEFPEFVLNEKAELVPAAKLYTKQVKMTAAKIQTKFDNIKKAVE